MNKLLVLILWFVTTTGYGRTEVENSLRELDNSIKSKNRYTLEKEERISNLRQLLTDDLPLVQEYQLNEKLVKEFRKFKLDPAIGYAQRNVEIAELLNNQEMVYSARIWLAHLYSSSGKYREAESLLKSIDTGALTRPVLAWYYEVWYLFYNYYASNTQINSYGKQIDLYCDSLLSVLTSGTSKYIITQVEKELRQEHWEPAEEKLLLLQDKTGNDTPEYALINYHLGYIYQKTGKIEQAIVHFARSAIIDIKNSLKDNASMQILASISYDRGDIDRAYLYTQSALEDAIFCNVQFRTIRLSEFYTIINSAYLDKEAKRKSQLQTYLILISLLSFFLIIAIVYVYRQMKKVSKIKQELHQTNDKLRTLNIEILDTNRELQERNGQLSEANLIKEEYIAHFFDLCSTYINKLEDYRKSLNKKSK